MIITWLLLFQSFLVPGSNENNVIYFSRNASGREINHKFYKSRVVSVYLLSIDVVQYIGISGIMFDHRFMVHILFLSFTMN